MKARMIVRALVILSVSCLSQLVSAGGNLLQIDSADQSIYHSVKWTDQQFPIVWHLSEEGYPGSGIDNAQLTLAIEAAFDTWSGLSSTIQFTNGGVIEESSVGVDGINLLTFTDQDYLFPSGIAAFAIHYTFSQETVIDDTFNDIDGDGNRDLPNGTYPPGTVYEADIVYNGSVDFAVSGINGTADLEGVTLHEVGHILGLSHSVITDTVMYPFLPQDITTARSLKLDDWAHLSHIYSLDIGFISTVSGKVINGFTGEPVVGAHVFVFDPTAGKQVVGAFSLAGGEYTIPGVTTGYIGIEPLNGSPIAKDPARINEVIKNTFDIDFIPEFYDTDESNIETSALTAQLFDLETQPGVLTPLTNIDIITNTSAPPGIGVRLRVGLNIFSYPVETLDGFAAFDLLQALGDETEINSIDHYNSASGRYERVYWESGVPTGTNFSIKRGEAYLVHMQTEKNVTFEGLQNCPLVQTKAGFNLVGVPCPPASYSAFDLLTTLGGGAVNVKRYNSDTAAFEVAVANVGNAPSGIDFPIVNGIGYVIEMLAEQGEVELSGDSQNFPAFISSISPGRALTGSQVSILGIGFSEDAIANEVLFNGVRAIVISASNNMLTVTVPTAATSGPVTVGTGGALSNSIEFVVESNIVTEEDVANKDIIDGQTVQGNLSNNDEQDRYSFIATKGSYVTATAIAPTGNPDLVLFLEGSSGEVLASDDNSAGATNPEIKRFKITQTGRYTVVVAALPGTGAGDYTFNLDIEHVPPVKDITIISGDAQTGVMGTQLSTPMEIYITGPDGFAISGIPITLTTDDEVTVSESVTAASYQVLTNSSGIVKINMTLPNVSGQYDIVIEVPGYAPKVIKASSVASLPVDVEIEGNGQDCGGNGCPVGQELPAPYKLRFLDAVGQPVPGVLVKFTVVSGEGGLVSNSVNVAELTRTSGANGEVSVTHSLGNIVFNKSTGVRIPQIIAATGTNPGAELWLFESIATAGVPAVIESLKTNNLRMTMGTSVLNALHIKVTDSFGNPVPDQEITTSTTGQLVVGEFDLGSVIPEVRTNENGEFIGAVTAVFAQFNLDPRIVAPTLDEFGARILDDFTPREPYEINFTVPGVAGGVKYIVDVDMGPRLIAIGSLLDGTPVGAEPNTPQWVGKALTQPVIMQTIRYRRKDSCVRDAFDNDFDAGDWRDEAHVLLNIVRIVQDDYAMDFYSERADGNIDDSNLSATAVAVPAYDPNGSVDAINGYARVNVQLGSVKGKVTINANTRNIILKIKAASTCGAIEANSDILSGASPLYMNPQIMDPPPGPPAVLSTQVISLSNTLPVLAKSPQIKIDVYDPLVTEPNPDPLQLKRSNSGLDLTKLKVELNGNFIYGGAIDTLLTKQYPNYIEAWVDGANISIIDANTRQAFSPNHFEFIYYPTAGEIDLLGANIVDVTNINDLVENIGVDFQKTFVIP